MSDLSYPIRVLVGGMAVLALAVAATAGAIGLAWPHAQVPSGADASDADITSPLADPRPENTAEFRGVNWADPRDNFAPDELVPTGLDRSMSYDEVHEVASWVMTDFASELEANTVRLPINFSTVDTDWWDAYRGTIDAARDEGFTVILSYWESNEEADGLIDDEAEFEAMWDQVVEAYRGDEGVFFEPVNEPHGYEAEQWIEVAAEWVERYEDEVPRDRMVISGSGYNEDVTVVGEAEELEGTLLSLHHYGFWDDHTSYDVWRQDLEDRLGDVTDRTLITEAGSPMTIGLNYANPEGDVSTAYLNALADVARENEMGIVYWPGLREADSYSMTRISAGGDALEVTDPVGLELLHWGWGLTEDKPRNDDPPAPPGDALRSSLREQCLDVMEGSSEPGAPVGLYDCNGGPNQSFDVRADGTIGIYGDMCLSRTPQGDDHDVVIQDCDGGDEQMWEVSEDGTVAPRGDQGTVLATEETQDGVSVVLAPAGGVEETWATP